MNFCSTTNAQPVLGTDYSFKLKGTNQYTFYLHTSFSFGSSSCPLIEYVKIQKSNDTLYLKAIYPLWGAWATMGCDNLDSIKYTHSDMSINYINVSTNSAGYSPPDYKTIDTAWNLFDTTFLVATASVKEHDILAELILYPNPTSHCLNIPKTAEAKELSIYNSMGQIILHEESSIPQSIDVSSFAKGFYFLTLYDKDRSKIGQGCFYKE